MTVNIKVIVLIKDPPERQATICCQRFADALEKGTDNEGYGSLISYEHGGVWTVSDELPPIKHCPWCGTDTGSNQVS